MGRWVSVSSRGSGRCQGERGKDHSRSHFIMGGSVRGTWNHPPPCCRVISKSHHHPESSAIPAVLAQFRGPCPQTTWSRGCHLSTELCVHLMPSFKLSLSWCLSNLLSSPIFLWLQPFILIFVNTLETTSQALLPGVPPSWP